MSILTLIYGVGTAKAKRARRGMERNWNQFNDPQRKFWRGKFSKNKWLQHRQKKFEKDVDNLRKLCYSCSVN